MNRPNETEQILEGLRPRMQAARVAHVRRLVGGALLVPLLGAGALAMASNAADDATIEVAAVEPTVEEVDVDLPKIGTAADDEKTGEANNADKADATTTTSEKPEVVEQPEQTSWEVGIAEVGGAVLEKSEDGELVMVDSWLEDGWEIVETFIVDGALKVKITNGEVVRTVTFKPGLRDEISVSIVEVVIPTTTTTEKPAPTTTKAPVVDRLVVEVAGKGSFVVERDGDTLWGGNVKPAEGYEATEMQSKGWKVWVGFTDGNHIWYGKAHITDSGTLETMFWEESIVKEPVAEPVYRWAEAPGVGAVQFKLWEGLVRVVDHQTAEGIGFWDYNGGAPAEVAKIDFEGEGVLVIIEAWGTESGEIAVEISG